MNYFLIAGVIAIFGCTSTFKFLRVVSFSVCLSLVLITVEELLYFGGCSVKIWPWNVCGEVGVFVIVLYGPILTSTITTLIVFYKCYKMEIMNALKRVVSQNKT